MELGNGTRIGSCRRLRDGLQTGLAVVHFHACAIVVILTPRSQNIGSWGAVVHRDVKCDLS